MNLETILQAGILSTANSHATHAGRAAEGGMELLHEGKQENCRRLRNKFDWKHGL